MNYEEYMSLQKDLCDATYNYIESQDKFDDKCQKLFSLLDDKKIKNEKSSLKEFLHMLLKISKNHHRSQDFFQKIEQIIFYFEEDIKKTFSNEDLFKFFKNDKKVLLYLLKKKIIVIDENISQYLTLSNELFFYPEIKSFINEEERKKFEEQLASFDEETFDEKREIGENDSYLCTLIRNDSVEEFISYANKVNLPFNSEIETSIFETNPFLLKQEKTTLIQYSAFCGSIQIFQYLRMNNANLDPSLILYAIHGKNENIIYFLEENHLINSYSKCLEESLKCHHNDIAVYIIQNLMNEKVNEREIIEYSLHYYNFSLIKNYSPNLQHIFNLACKYDYINLVKLLIDGNEININAVIDENSKDSSLHNAALKNNVEIIDILLKNPNIVIKNDSFTKCQKLTNVSLPPILKEIENNMFDGCKSLVDVSIPSSVTKIGWYAFKNCSSLKEIFIPSSVQSFGNSAFENCINLKHINIPSSVTRIGSFCFMYCSSLEEIEIPDSITEIDGQTFFGCRSLKNVKIPLSVKHIRANAFCYCTSLESIKIPKSVQLGINVFNGCSILKNVSAIEDQ